MKNMMSNPFNEPFDLSHATIISIVVHFLFISIHPFEFSSEQPVVQKKYKKIRLQVIERPKTIITPVSTPVKKDTSKSYNKPVKQITKQHVLVKPVVTPVLNRFSQSFSVKSPKLIRNNEFKSTKPSAQPRRVKHSLQTGLHVVASPVQTTQAGSFINRGIKPRAFAMSGNASTRLSGSDNTRIVKLESSENRAGFSLKGLLPKPKPEQSENFNSDGIGKSSLVETNRRIGRSIKPQAMSVATLKLEQQLESVSAEELRSLWAGYTNLVRQKIARAKIYPAKARDKRQQGKIHLTFKLGKDGEVLKLFVEHSSGNEILDEAARDAVRKAVPFPPIPEKLNRQYALMKLPISFVLK